MKSKLTLLIVVALALTLVAGAVPSAAQDGGVEVVMWFTGSDQQAEAVQVAADIWAEATGNTAVIEAVPWSDALARAQTATASGEGADILVGGMSWGISLGALGGMVNLAEEFPEDIAAIQEASNTGFWDAIVSLDGSVYYIPYNLDIYLMYYLVEALEAVGYDGAPATWEELTDAVGKMQEEGALGMATIWGNGDWLSFTNILYQAGGQWYTDDCSAPAVNSEEGMVALEFFVSMYEDLGAPSENITLGTGLSTGDYPIVIDGEWTASGIDISFPELEGRWAVAPLPAGPSGNYTAFIGGKGMGIFSYSDNVEEAFDLMKFLGTEEAAKAQTEAYDERREIFVPPQTAWGEYIKGGDVVKDALNAQLADAIGPPNCPGWEETNAEVTLQLQAAVFESADFEDVLYEMEALMADGIEEYGG
jgi:multiple sugar transport system substrate-binding protein